MGCNKRYELNERSIEILAQRAINGEFGNEEERKKELGDVYEKVQKKVLEIIGVDKTLTIEELANKVLKGELGNGEERKNKLGELYAIVQNRVNEILENDFRNDINEESIEILAQRVLKGEFGNGEERKKKLGELFPFVQNRVNEILGCNTVYEEKPIPSYIKLNSS